MAKQYFKLPPLEVEPELAEALNAYAKQLGVPRARVIRDILRAYMGPLASSGVGHGVKPIIAPANPYGAHDE